MLTLWVTAFSLARLYAPGAAQTGIDIETYDLSMTKGVLAFEDGRYDRAEELFREALTAKPGDSAAGQYLGDTLIRAKKFEPAETVYKRMVEAEPASGKALLGLGIAQYHLERYRDALANLNAAEQVLPDDPLIQYYQGLTYLRLEAFDRSQEKFDRAKALSPELAASAQYHSGIAHYRRGNIAQARAEFEAVIQTQPVSELARSAKEFLGRPEPTPTVASKRWNLSLMTSAEWDSNVVLLPGGTQPPGGSTGISRKGDYRTVLYGRGEFRAIQREDWTAGFTYGIYQSFHRTLSGFDVEDHAPSVFVQHQLGRLTLALQYVFNYTLVGRSPYLISHSIQPLVTFVESDRWLTQFLFRYQNKDFQHGRFLINSARDGKNWLAGVTQYFLFADRTGFARIGYIYDTDRTGGGAPDIAPLPGTPTNSDWAYHAHRVLAGVDLPPIWTLRVGLAFDYYRQNYDHPNSFSLDGMTRRHDDIYIFTGSVSRNLTENLALTFQYTYTRDQNNIPVFDYSRNIYSLVLTGQF
jgi:tetratricopeptide (TPR) repeat protein